MSVEERLGLTPTTVADLVDEHWDRWRTAHAILQQVAAPAQIRQWMAAAPSQRSDQVQLALAQLAAIDGGDDPGAARLLAAIMLPAATRIAGQLAHLSPDIDELVAGQLWLEIRTFNWETGHKFAANVAWRVRCGALREAQTLFQRASLNERLNATALRFSYPCELDLLDAGEGPRLDAEPEPYTEVLQVLEWGRDQGLITAADRTLLLVLVQAAWEVQESEGRASSGPVGLLNERTAARAGELLGLTGRTTRRHARRALNRLAEAAHTYRAESA